MHSTWNRDVDNKSILHIHIIFCRMQNVIENTMLTCELLWFTFIKYFIGCFGNIALTPFTRTFVFS